MSATRSRKTGAARPRPDTAGPPTIPMKPRPRALAVLSVAFAVWVGVLVTLYFVTVRPHRAAAPEAPPAPAAPQ